MSPGEVKFRLKQTTMMRFRRRKHLQALTCPLRPIYEDPAAPTKEYCYNQHEYTTLQTHRRK